MICLNYLDLEEAQLSDARLKPLECKNETEIRELFRSSGILEAYEKEKEKVDLLLLHFSNCFLLRLHHQLLLVAKRILRKLSAR